jgi:predicted nucleic acid-binding protein
LKRYLLDTNHLSAYLDRRPIKARITAALLSGNRFGVCLPVLCEYRAGIRQGRKQRENLRRLATSMKYFRIWPMTADTPLMYAETVTFLKSIGQSRAQFDVLIAAIAEQHSLTILTADRDFDVIPNVDIENWL